MLRALAGGVLAAAFGADGAIAQTMGRAGTPVSFEAFTAYFSTGEHIAVLEGFNEVTRSTVEAAFLSADGTSLVIETRELTVLPAPAHKQTGQFVKIETEGQARVCSPTRTHASAICAPLLGGTGETRRVFVSRQPDTRLHADDQPISDFDAFMAEDFARIGIDYFADVKPQADRLRALGYFLERCVWSGTAEADMICYSQAVEADMLFIRHWMKGTEAAP